MRYSLIDLEGAVRDRFSSRSALLEALRDAQRDDPGLLEELYVFTHDDQGARQSDASRADEVLAAAAGDPRELTLTYWTGVFTGALGDVKAKAGQLQLPDDARVASKV